MQTDDDGAPFEHRWENLELGTAAPTVGRLTVPDGWLYCVEGHPPVYVRDDAGGALGAWTSQVKGMLAAMGIEAPRGELLALDGGAGVWQLCPECRQPLFEAPDPPPGAVTVCLTCATVAAAAPIGAVAVELNEEAIAGMDVSIRAQISEAQARALTREKGATTTDGDAADVESDREWTQAADETWSSDDGISIDGSPGHYFPTHCRSSLGESDNPQGAMATADAHWPYPAKRYR